jgi:glycosyltransferase involved in cell wall biosynthesis
MTTLSLVVCTVNRSQELIRLFQSLVHQAFKDFEVVVVDQNKDDRLASIVAQTRWPYPVRHVRTPEQSGLTRARNTGLQLAVGTFVLFPDDDCWYPEWFLQKGIDLLGKHNAAAVTGRAADRTGKTINGRFQEVATWIDRENVWTTQIEWVVFFRRDAVLAVGGYNESIGVGAATPWGANEGQDITLRLLTAGFTAYYDPALYGFHAELGIASPDAAMMRKGRSYGRGFGYVLRLHHYGVSDLAYWLVRPLGGSILFVTSGRWAQARYHANVALGRLEGWLGRTIDVL